MRWEPVVCAPTIEVVESRMASFVEVAAVAAAVVDKDKEPSHVFVVVVVAAVAGVVEPAELVE